MRNIKFKKVSVLIIAQVFLINFLLIGLASIVRADSPIEPSWLGSFRWDGINQKIIGSGGGKPGGATITQPHDYIAPNNNGYTFIQSDNQDCLLQGSGKIIVDQGSKPVTGKYVFGAQTIDITSPNGQPKCSWNEANAITISIEETGVGCPGYNGTEKLPKNGDKRKNYRCLSQGRVVNGKYDSNDLKNPENQKPATTTDATNNEANCDDALSPMGWVLCPIMNFADNMYDWFKTLANELLFFETDKYQPGQKSEGLYNSWKTMVKIANTILVLVGVVIIAGQIFSFEFINAYTVKKALPRLVIAAILIQLSWIMVTTGVQMVNAIGAGLYWLLVAPFKIASDGSNILEIGSIIGSSSANQGGGVANGVGFGVVIAAMTGVVATSILTGAWVSIIMAAVGVLVSLAVAIVVLLLREATLIILIAISPIAIALWILPGTEGIWKLWWKTFSRLLMMYPLIMLLFAGGTISAIILAQSSSYINLLFAIVVYFIPIFLISATYKFAGGAFASMASFTEKIGGKVKSGGMLGLRDRAKFQKENSSWNLAKKSREADRQRNSQTKYADKLTGTGRYSKFLQQRSGIGDVGRQRAMAGAAATITAEKQQAFKNDQALAEFQIQKLAAGASEWQLDDDGKVQLDDGGNKISASLYDKQRQTRAAIMGAETGGIASINGQDVNITQALQNHTALQSLQNKDGSKGLLDYVDSSHASLSDLATENSEAYSTLIKHAPAIAKSDGPSVKTPGNRSYQQALENFSEISHIQWKRDTVGALQQQLATNPDQAVANLSQMARNPAIKTNDLAMISKAVGFDLSDLRNNENAVLRYDPPAPLPVGASGPLPLGKLRM